LAAFYFDQNVSHQIVTLLRASGHQVTTAYDIGLDRAEDDEHFLVAAQRGWTLVTTNIKDFRLLHYAWRRWFAAHGVSAEHHGVLIVPQRQPAERIVQAILDLLTTDATLTNELHEWSPGDGWIRRPS
jgi:predicted nuclease of predicted toxin-antitoxin system